MSVFGEASGNLFFSYSKQQHKTDKSQKIRNIILYNFFRHLCGNKQIAFASFSVISAKAGIQTKRGVSLFLKTILNL
jgi:hypothetical protein